MTLTELLRSQLIDPFRFGMLIFLFVTMLRTRAASGTLWPLAAGVVFVAILIPLTLSQVPVGPTLYRSVAAGIVTNLFMLAVIWLAYRMLPKRRPKPRA